MNILVIGSGGREHAFVWKLAESQSVQKVFVAPGNAGTALEPECENIPINPMDFDGLIKFAKEHDVDITIVGPEAPLCAGIVDHFEEAGLSCFGPRKNAAQLEGSKAWAKGFMERHKIPTARYYIVRRSDLYGSNYAGIFRNLRAFGLKNCVVKADGLAA